MHPQTIVFLRRPKGLCQCCYFPFAFSPSSLFEPANLTPKPIARLRTPAEVRFSRTAIVTVEHPFGTLKMRMGATHFLMKTLPKVATEMALHVLAYNLTRVMNILGIKPLLAAIRA